MKRFLLCLMVWIPVALPARGQDVQKPEPPGGAPPAAPAGQKPGSTGEITPAEREARWVASNVRLDRLPAAYPQARRPIRLSNAIKMMPIGFPASSYTLYPAVTFRVAPQTQLGLGAAGGNGIGDAGTAVFYTLGVQHLVQPEARRAPALAVGGYGFLGPDDRHGGAAYVVASRQFSRHAYPHGVFAHLGVLGQSFADGDSGASVRPFVGANYVLNRRVRFTGEYRPRMPWEEAAPYGARVVFLFTGRFGVSAGIRQNGYERHSLLGIELE
jgi:hypothetical protein